MIGDYSPDQPRDESGRWSDGGGIKSITPRTPGATVELNYGKQAEAFKIQAGGAHVLGYVKNQDFPTSYEFKPTRGEVFYAQVPAASQKRGVGTSLVRDALALMRANGTETVNMSTTSDAGRKLVDKLIREGDISSPIQTAPSGKAEHRILTRRASDAPPKPKPITWPQPRYGAQGRTSEIVKQHIANNVDLIKSIPQQYFDRIADDIYNNMVSAQRWEDLADTLQETLKYDFQITQSRANLIARDQTSKLNGAFNQDRQESVGVTHYQWQSSKDERVRPLHQDYDGQVFAWSDPPEDGHPGQPVSCRCVALPLFEEMGEVSEAVEGYGEGE